MTAGRWQQIKAIFDLAVEISPLDREQFLLRECGDDQELRLEVQTLLDADQASTISVMQPLAFAAVMASLPPPSPKANPIFKERYEVVRELGQGGMSVVYLARDLQLLDKPVVVKVLAGKSSADPYLQQKFHQEMEALARIDHPGVVAVLDYGQSPDGQQFLVMQYIDGTTLRQAISPTGMDSKRVAGLVRQIADALSTAHSKGVLHRDLKPENVMLQQLGREEHAKLIDFGISGIENSQFAQIPTRVAGTMNYMSPEQFAGKASAASDTYSLGVIAFEMLTGERPFSSDTLTHLVAEDRLIQTRLHSKCPELPKGTVESITKAMAFQADQRHANISDFGDELHGVLHGETAAVDASVPSRRVAIGGAVLIAALGLGGISLSRKKLPQALPAPVPTHELNYYVTVQKYRDGKPYQDPFRLSGERIFEADYRIRLVLSSPEAGHLYVLNEGPLSSNEKPDLNLLEIKQLHAKQSSEIPIAFDEQKGKEKLWLVWSRTPLEQLELLKQWMTPRFRGAIGDPQQARTALAFLRSKPQATKKEQAGLTVLNGDLVVRLVELEHE